MHLLFITDNFPPEVNAPATRTYEHCRKWVKMGAKVTVLTCAPNFPQGKVYDGYKNQLYKVEHIDGIRVVRVWSFIVANEGFAMRVLDHLSFAFSAFWAGLFQQQPDVVIATSPQFFTTFTAVGLSVFRRCKWLFEVRDMWPEGIIFMKKESLVYKILEKIELFLYRNADAIVTVTESFKRNIAARSGVNANKIEVIYNGSNRQLFQAQPKDAELLRGLQLEGKFVIGYAGTLGISHNLDFLIEQLPEIYRREPHIHFLFVGGGAMFEPLKKRMAELNLANMTLLPPVPKAEMPRYLSLFDVGLVPLKRVEAYLKVIPSKIFELAAMRKPVLLGVMGESQAIVERLNAGVCFIPDDAADFVAKTLALYAAKDALHETYAANLDALAVEFDRETLAEKMHHFIKNRLA